MLLAAVVTVMPPASAAASAFYGFSTYFGGGEPVGSDRPSAVEVDAEGNLYIVGSVTGDLTLPSVGGVPEVVDMTGDDVFVAKFDPSGALIFASLFGGSNNDNGLDLAVDGAGSVYVAGTTTSIDFPVTAGAFQEAFGGGSDAFIAKLSPDGGTLVYASYLGGDDASEAGWGVAVDSEGHAYVTGRSPSLDFPVTPGAFDTDCGNGGNCVTFSEDVFVSKVSSAGTRLIYSTFLGGDERDVGHDIRVAEDGSVIVVGTTHSTDFPVSGDAYQSTSAGGPDAFIAVLSPSGDALEYGTYIGGSGTDQINSVARHPSGDLYLAGYTRSNDFPTTLGAFDEVCGSGDCSESLDAFAIKMRADGTAPVYSTYLGGDGLDFGFGVAVDDTGHLHIAGTTSSLDFPVEAGIQAMLESDLFCALDASGIENGFPCSDLFVAKLAPDGASLLFSDFIGGTDGETNFTTPSFNHNLAVSAAGEVYVVGVTYSDDYPAVEAFRGGFLGPDDVVVTKIEGMPGSSVLRRVVKISANR